MTETQYKKGQKSGPGRPRGTHNHVTKQLKDMILSALDQAGGVDYLIGCAKDPKTAAAFLSLIGKVLPSTIQGARPDGDLVITMIERRIVDPRR